MALQARSERAVATPGAQMVEAVSLLTGLFIAASPWIVGFSGLTTLAVTNLIAGLAFVLLVRGVGGASAYDRTHAMSWAAIGIGIWTVVAPWAIVGDVSTTRSIIANTVGGGVAALLGLATAAMAARGRPRQPRA
ncbi:SPW repeat protein [Streptomyces sp. PLAI1-29]|uniref:SPW repeat protein n=2 Tax=Streptomyces zingiberis TaxID=2053010 RepID=A0ABX1C3P9_9ACTN|nr:SPW repeat protein [Streptomyces zingiberis]